MTIWFISRHPGAIEWVKAQALAIDRFVAHLDPAQVQAGDTVAGSLPVQLAAEICARGARYLHLSVDLPAEYRGRELSAQDLQRFHARLTPFIVTAAPDEAADRT